MSTENQQSKVTPNRRRQGGRHRNTPKQTAYASENDVPKYGSIHLASPSTPPSETVLSQRTSLTNSKQQNKSKSNKKRNNRDGTPALDRSNTDCESPSLPTKSASGPIFAGSTFHASPAPSSLPIPSFLTKSKTDTPGMGIDSSPEQGLSSATTDSDEASPPSPPSIQRTDESPLEFIFRADRAEKEKAKIRRASSSLADTSTTGPFSPPHESPKEVSTFPKSTASNQTRRPLPARRIVPLIGMSPEEQNRHPGRPIGPAFSTPYSERMRAARSNHNSTQASPAEVRSQDLDSLKRYLFTGQASPDGPRSPPGYPTPDQHFFQDHRKPHTRAPRADIRPHPSDRLPRGMFPASILTANAQNNQSSSPSAGARTDRIATMEDDLKRILKLDSPSPSLTLS
ncbi:uncharacterized protein F4822DRAFT_365557 [Hypoxylon trugodes]|uniref:uncharacterized protein n=1 Tax=Hypoxylon trugodes TaxID=326681 RepID=UPI002195AE5E|nr:uncharacterized protein F4822DRAFT_365557 [Hypoxylon trugodes]KAI1384502.1 hypothetical protein F4822DRAFT_365557 [Hypoxylon trugodes]